MSNWQLWPGLPETRCRHEIPVYGLMMTS